MKNSDSTTPQITRRGFLKTAAAASALVAAPSIVPSSVFGANAPSNRITFGVIGTGRMGRGDMTDLMGQGTAQIITVCDADSNRMADAKTLAESRQEVKGVDMQADFRDVIARDDVDAVMICTPDHWHSIPAIHAARAGKSIFMQKPFGLSIVEGRAVADAARRYGTVFIVGSQQRSDSRFRFACELVRNGRIGELKSVEVGSDIDPAGPVTPPMDIPKNLNYDLWLGQAPWSPYTEKRVHPQKGYDRPGWLRIADYGAGMLTGWGSHHMDIAHWGMGMENSGPVEIEGKAEFPKDGIWDVHGNFTIKYLYPNGVPVTYTDNAHNKQGVTFYGSEGWVYVRRGFIDAQPKSLLRSVIGPNEIHLYESNNHKANLIECIKTRRETVAPPENGHRSCSACLLADLACRLGRKLHWDPKTEHFVNDPEANRMLLRPMRSPWHL